MKKIIAIFGGNSTEHDVSIITAIEGLNACPYGEYKVYPVYIKGDEWYSSESMFDLKTFINFEPKNHKKVRLIGKSLYYDKRGKWKFLDDVDCALLFTHGGEGECGALQGMLDILGVPYTSPEASTCALMMDKYLLKLLLKDLKIGVVKGALLGDDSEESMVKVERGIGYPLFIKPNSQGSSIGVGKAENREELKEKLAVAFAYDDKVLVEKCMDGFIEYNCAVVRSGETIMVSEVERPVTAGDFLSFEDKYLDFTKTACLCKREFPAKINEDLRCEIRSICQSVYEKLHLKGVVRFDFIYKNRLYLNEINAIPGSLAHYLFDNLTYTDFLTLLIEEGIEKGTKKYPEYKSEILSTSGKMYK